MNALDSYFNQTPSSPPPQTANGASKAAPVVIPRSPALGVWNMLQVALMPLIALAGLALFHGTLAGGKNRRNVCASFLGCAALAVLLWWSFGYSLAFGVNFQSSSLGGSEYFFLPRGTDPATSVGAAPNTNYGAWVSQNVFAISHAIFAMLSAGVIVAALAQRVKWSTLLLFIAPWLLLVYCPVAHMVWGANGLMNGVFNVEARLPALDFAGGLVLHVTAGWSALVFSLVLGLRPRWGRVPEEPPSIMRTIAGTGLLWIGWLGYAISLTPDSSIDVDGIVTSVVTARTIAAACGGLVWVVLDVIFRRPVPLRGFCFGIITGLVAISSADGFVTNTGAAIIALCASGEAYVCANYLTTAPGFEIARKVFAIHGVGGAVGVVLTGLLANAAVNGNLARLVPRNGGSGINGGVIGHPLVLFQLGAVLVTLLISSLGTFVIAYTLKAALQRLRPGVSAPRLNA